MNEQFRITPRPQLRDQAAPVKPLVAAQPGNYMAAAPAPDHELTGLVNGLSALNPALARLQQVQVQEQRQQQQLEDALGRKQAHSTGAAVSQQHPSPRDALTGEEIPLPQSISPAYSNEFRAALHEGLAQRVAVQNKLDAIAEYHDLKDTEGFNEKAWIQERRAAALQGIKDLTAQAIIGQHFTQLEADIGTENERARVKQMEETKVQNATLWASDMFTGDMDANRLLEAFKVYQQRVATHNISKNEAAQHLMLQLVAQSNKLGGAPELFDVFNVKDEEGKTLADRNPAIAAHAQQAKEQARMMRDKALDKASEQTNAKVLSQYESDIDTNPGSVTMDRLLADFTDHGAFRSPHQVASMWGRAQDALRKQAGTLQLMAYFDSGELWRLEPGQQNKIMDARMGPLIDRLAEANRNGDTDSISAIGAEVLRMHSKAGATVAFDQLKGFASHLVTTAPNKEGPTAGFNAAAALYRAMSGMPKYRDLYFNEDVSKVLDAYTSAEKAGTDPKAAYVQAYQSVSPEAKAAAEAYTKTPEFQKMASKESEKWVTGSGMNWLRLFGGNGRPQNAEVVGAALAQEMRSWRARNPFATADQAAEYAEKWTGANFVIDHTSRSAVRVPSGFSAPAVQEALSGFSAELVKRYSLGDRNDAKWSVQYVPVGTEGDFQPVLFNGSATQALPPVNVRTLLAADAARKSFTEEERVLLGKMRLGVAAGQLPLISTELLGKAEALGVLKPAELKAYRDASNKAFMDRLNATPKVTLGTPSFDNLQHLNSKPVKIDNELTASTARELMASPLMGPAGHHLSYGASLIAMGEGVALKSYEDPAAGAGRNIGMGYNLKANEKNVRSDLKRAMVPEDRIDDVINGKADLTPDQAKRLLMVALPRYEKQVQEVAEGSSPGLWARMTPAQKAVMLDVAWQVGSTDKFKKAWAALAAGDMPNFANETKVFYTDRATGERKEDTRRNNLRAAMLSGLSQWEAIVDKYGSLPATKLAALRR